VDILIPHAADARHNSPIVAVFLATGRHALTVQMPDLLLAKRGLLALLAFRLSELA